ncbi:MAG: hypothetical protein IJV40_12110 [Oscillospiraceae bacterium]|nr:hypothetical protein [Oscillospiraceae bacterium]
MKRIISFLILLATFIVILTLPTTEATPAYHNPQPLPIWSILLYVAVVAVALIAVMVLRRENRRASNGVRRVLTGGV